MGVLSNLDATGFTFSDYPTHLSYIQGVFQSIYGSDIYLEPDSQDGQLCAAFATAIYDQNQMMAQVINSLLPTYAQGTQLSAAVLINGISRATSTYSTSLLTLTGTIGTVIGLAGASAIDTNGYIWNIATCTIGTDGTAQALATCATPGAIAALPNTINKIYTPIYGWTSVTNQYAATLGLAVESDAALRQRQSISASISSQTTLAGLYGALLSLTNVTKARVMENNTDTTDTYGNLPHSITVITEGGLTQDIVNTIGMRKTMGCNTNGTTSGTYTDPFGLTTAIKFFQVAYTPIYISISLHEYTGFTSATAASIQTSLADYINGLAIGQSIFYSRLYTYANLAGGTDGLLFDITSLTVGTSASPTGTSDIAIAYNYAAQITPANIIITAV
jgi:uncharacterized phage protein gp47/JayE